ERAGCLALGFGGGGAEVKLRHAQAVINGHHGVRSQVEGSAGAGVVLRAGGHVLALVSVSGAGGGAGIKSYGSGPARHMLAGGLRRTGQSCKWRQGRMEKRKIPAILMVPPGLHQTGLDGLACKTAC